MSEERLTREQMLEARLNSLERRMEQLESWTGADEDGNWGGGEASVDDRLDAQQIIIAHLLQHLEFLIPDFSTEKVRKGLHMVYDNIRGNAPRDDLSAEEAEAARLRWYKIIDDHLPRQSPQAKVHESRFRPTLVPKAPDAAPSAHAGDE